MLLDWPPSWRQRGRTQPIDEAEDFSEQVPRHRSLGQLEGDVPPVTDHFCTDLHQLLPQRGQQSVLYLLRQGQRPHEVTEIVGKGVKLQPDRVVAELPARQPRPLDDVFAFLDPLLGGASVIVKCHHPFGGPADGPVRRAG